MKGLAAILSGSLLLASACSVSPPPPPPTPPPPYRADARAANAPVPVAEPLAVQKSVSDVAGGYLGATEAPLSIADQYSPIREHAFMDARKEATTTFAIDVDRASYANVRRMLSHNQIPPADAVRLEEM